jgi:hypothetical protein
LLPPKKNVELNVANVVERKLANFYGSWNIGGSTIITSVSFTDIIAI